MAINKDMKVDAVKRKLLRLENRKKHIFCKFDKIKARIKVLNAFVKANRNKNVTLGEWAEKRNFKLNTVFAPLGYYCPKNKAVSDDVENEYLNFSNGMVYSSKVGYHTPLSDIVADDVHNEIMSGANGYTYNPKLAQYFPSQYSSFSDNKDEEITDVLGGFSMSDIGNFSAFNDDGEENIEEYVDFLEEEYDNVEEEYDAITDLEDEIDDDYSEFRAFGIGKRSSKQEAKRKERKRKKAERKSIRKEEKGQRKKDRATRKQARKDKRSNRKDLKRKMKAGEISRKEFRQGKKAGRKKKRKIFKEAGGSFLNRAWKTFAKINPLTALARTGAIYILAKMNGFGLATRLAPAVVDDKTAKEKFKPNSIAKAKKGWKNVSKIWRGLGGSEGQLKMSIREGWKKKVKKIKKKKGVDGSTVFEIESEQFSNVEYTTATIVAMVTAGLSVISGIVVAVNKSKMDKNPYLSEQTPEDYEKSLRAGDVTDDVPVDPDAPVVDPATGKWIDPQTGQEVDPTTGEILDDKILGLPKMAVYLGGGVVILVLAILVIKKMNK